MFQSDSTNDTETRWRTLKAQGKSHYEEGNYSQALQAYQDALKSLGNQPRSLISAESTERQILLSNSVACRIKLGGRDMALKAVEEAKEVRMIKFMSS